MKYGSLPLSITRTLPADEIEPAHTPDGLTEADIDALIAESGIDLGPEPAAGDDDQSVGQVIPLHPAGKLHTAPIGGEAA